MPFSGHMSQKKPLARNVKPKHKKKNVFQTHTHVPNRRSFLLANTEDVLQRDLE
jgi:hypothetical protein